MDASTSYTIVPGTAQYIETLVRKMDDSKARWAGSPDYEERVRAECPVLARDYDAIFAKHLANELTEEIFRMFADMRKVERGGKSFDADVRVGSRVLDTWVNPAIGRESAPTLSYAAYLEKMKR